METSFIQPFSEEGFEIVDLNEVEGPVPDEDLIDTFDESRELVANIRLSFNINEYSEQSADILFPEVRKPALTYSDAQFPGYTVDAGRSHTGIPGDIINPDVVPDVLFDPYSQDYYLHPSLHKRRRRRRQYIVVY